MENLLVQEIAERKSVTNWTDKKISPETWAVLLEAARRAPSSWNHQPARYVIVDDEESKKRLCEALHRTNSWAARAAGLVVQVAAPEDDDVVDGKTYYLYDCGLSMMSLVYQAQSMGITSRQMIGWDESEVKRILGIPERYRVVVITGLGYPSTSVLSTTLAEFKRHATSQHKRNNLDEMVFWQCWQGGKGE
jgi:nitroreductase